MSMREGSLIRNPPRTQAGVSRGGAGQLNIIKRFVENVVVVKNYNIFNTVARRAHCGGSGRKGGGRARAHLVLRLVYRAQLPEYQRQRGEAYRPEYQQHENSVEANPVLPLRGPMRCQRWAGGGEGWWHVVILAAVSSTAPQCTGGRLLRACGAAFKWSRNRRLTSIVGAALGAVGADVGARVAAAVRAVSAMPPSASATQRTARPGAIGPRAHGRTDTLRGGSAKEGIDDVASQTFYS